MACETAPVPRPPQPITAIFISPSNAKSFFELAGSLLSINPAAAIFAEWPMKLLRFNFCFLLFIIL